MRILYIGGFDLPDKNAAAHRVIANAKAFRELGFDVTLVGLDKTVSSFSYDGFECYNLKYPVNAFEWIDYLTSIKSYLSFIELIHPQMVIAYNHPAIALSKLAGVCKKHRIKVVSDCTEWYTPEGSFIQRAIKRWDTNLRMTKIHLHMDGIISISRYLLDYYTKRGVPSLLLPPLVDIHDEKWRIENKRPVSSSNEIVLTYAGSPGHKDSLDRIIRIVDNLPGELNVRFEIVGLTREQFINSYNYEGGLSSRVHFNGRMPHSETLRQLFVSDFQIFIREDSITTRAGFPTKFVESITAGVPVLTNMTSNIGDYLSNGVNGYPLDATSDESLNESLLQVLSLKRESIDSIKKSINRDIFDYRLYVSQIKLFIDNILFL